MAVITVTIPSPGGTATITDETAVAIGLLTKAVALQTSMIEKNIGELSSKSQGSIGASMSASVDQQKIVVNRLIALETALITLNANLMNVTKQLSTLTTGVAHAVNIQAQQLTTQQMVAADQLKNNKFTQANTNAALVEAGKEPIVVKPDEVKQSIIDSVKDVGTIKVQTAATTAISETVAGGITAAYTTTVGWAAETAVGKFIADQFLNVEAAAKSLFSDKTFKQEKDALLAEKASLKAGNLPSK